MCALVKCVALASAFVSSSLLYSMVKGRFDDSDAECLSSIVGFKVSLVAFAVTRVDQRLWYVDVEMQGLSGWPDCSVVDTVVTVVEPKGC